MIMFVLLDEPEYRPEYRSRVWSPTENYFSRYSGYIPIQVNIQDISHTGKYPEYIPIRVNIQDISQYIHYTRKYPGYIPIRVNIQEISLYR